MWFNLDAAVQRLCKERDSRMELMEKTVESRVLFEGKIITVRLDKAELPNGRVASREVVEHPAGWLFCPCLTTAR